MVKYGDIPVGIGRYPDNIYHCDNIWDHIYRFVYGVQYSIRGVTIHRYIDISYRECQRYTYRIVGACIDTHGISSCGRNQTIKCP